MEQKDRAHSRRRLTIGKKPALGSGIVNQGHMSVLGGIASAENPVSIALTDGEIIHGAVIVQSDPYTITLKLLDATDHSKCFGYKKEPETWQRMVFKSSIKWIDYNTLLVR